MRTLKLIVFGITLLLVGTMHGQISVSLHFGTPPQWGPVGYSDDGNSSVRYYYLPDVEAYYDIQASRFIYYDGRSWVRRAYLPGRYRNYDLYGGYKVVMTDYHGNTPYTHFRDHKSRYQKGYRGNEQRNIGSGNRSENSHAVNRLTNQPNDNSGRSNQAQSNNKNKNNGHNNGRGNGRGNENGNRK